MKISRREKILIAVAVYALMIFFGFKYVILPTQAELSKVKAANSKIDEQVQQAVQDGKLNSDYQSAISKGLANYLELEEQLPRDKQLVELVDQLGTMAAENNVTLLSVGYQDTKQQPATEKLDAKANGKDVATSVSGTSNMNLSLSTSGTYYHLLSYLQALEQSPRIIIVESTTLSVGQKEQPAASGSTGSTGTYTGSSSSNPPPSAPIAKGTRVQTQTSAVTGTVAAPVQSTVSEPVVPEMTKFDAGNVQMNLEITSYYDQTGSELDKLLSLEQIKILTGGATVSTAADKNIKLVTAAVKKYWNEEDPSANWSNSRNPRDDCWNGKLLKYLEGKYNNTNMGKNVRKLVNPLAAKINPDSDWAGTAIFHWDRLLDMNMSSTVKPVDPDTDKVYTNVKTRDFLPVAVYITYLPNYDPEKVASLSISQKQAVTGSIIVWQAKDSKAAPVVYRIDEKGKLQDLQKLE